MRKVNDHFEEEYIYLADLTHNAALISWGKFFFDQKMELIKDKKLRNFQGLEDRRTCIGESSQSYGAVNVEVLDAAGNIVVQHANEGLNYRWMKGLEPDTEYTYRVRVQRDGETYFWGDGPLSAYSDREGTVLVVTDTGRRYDCRFRTFPSEDRGEPLTFAVIGDTGTASRVQDRVAEALEKSLDASKIRLVLLVGDTIYKKDSGGSGDDDDEWLTTYFQPYRHVISRVPVFPCMGNHDTKEGFFTGLFVHEKQGDRETLYDNLLLKTRFLDELPEGREAQLKPLKPEAAAFSISRSGLFYRFKFGSDIEFICLDTSKEGTFDQRLYRHDHYEDWVRGVIQRPLGSPRWRIPFTHHPPYCGGPRHGDDEANLREWLIRLCAQNGIRTILSGHEHNFQCIDSDSVTVPMPMSMRCLITGGAGKNKDSGAHKEDPPDSGKTKGKLFCWGGADRGHFLIVEIKDGVMTVKPMGETRDEPIPLFDRAKQPLLDAPPITVTL